MKKISLFLLVFVFLVSSSPAKTSSDVPVQTGMAFRENKGQIHDQNYQPRPDVLFGAMAGPMAFHLRNKGVSYQLYRTERWKETTHAKTKELRREIELQTIYRIDLNWLGANKNFKVIPDAALPGYNNYYLENCPMGAVYVRSFSGVWLHQLYEGIDLHYYEKDGQLKHDYAVAPGADYKQIRVSVAGAEIELGTTGNLILRTPLGSIEEGRPLVFQGGRMLKSRWVVQNSVLSFEIEGYDPKQELLIDPVTRLWGTYYGGSSDEYGYGCSTDGSGNAYVTGRSDSSGGSEIATSGTHQQSSGGFSEAYVVKFDPKGQRLWGTYYGGSGADVSNACAADSFGNVFLVGSTSSSSGNAIATPGAHQTSYQGTSADAFLAKLNVHGIRQWGTYYGSFGWDIGWGCATDASGNVYMTGETSSGSLIASAGAHQQGYGGGFADAFLVKFDSVGTRLWGTFYGGNDDEDGRSCATDASGNVYMTGSTYNIPGSVIATTGSHQENFGGGSLDAYLVKFNSSGVREWGTYYGGFNYDYGYSCATDASGNVFLSGNTNGSSGTLIATPGCFQSSSGGGTVDAFLAKFNSNGQRTWGTYYGSFGSDDGFSCSTDALGNVYLGGRTSSGGLMVSSGGFQQTYGGGTYDAYVAKFSSTGSRPWATYYGTSGTDYGRACAADRFGNVFLAGETTSSSGLSSSGCHQELSGGLLDAFLVKISDCTPLNALATADSVVCMGFPLNLSVSVSGAASYTFNWQGPSNYSATQQNPLIPSASTLNIGVYTVTVFNGGCGDIATVQVLDVLDCTGIDDLGTSHGLAVYPNPSQGIFTIALPSAATYRVLDLLGREIQRGELLSGENSLDLQGAEKGAYLVQISDGRVIKTWKVLVE